MMTTSLNLVWTFCKRMAAGIALVGVLSPLANAKDSDSEKFYHVYPVIMGFDLLHSPTTDLSVLGITVVGDDGIWNWHDVDVALMSVLLPELTDPLKAAGADVDHLMENDPYPFVLDQDRKSFDAWISNCSEIEGNPTPYGLYRRSKLTGCKAELGFSGSAYTLSQPEMDLAYISSEYGTQGRGIYVDEAGGYTNQDNNTNGKTDGQPDGQPDNPPAAGIIKTVIINFANLGFQNATVALVGFRLHLTESTGTADLDSTDNAMTMAAYIDHITVNHSTKELKFNINTSYKTGSASQQYYRWNVKYAVIGLPSDTVVTSRNKTIGQYSLIEAITNLFNVDGDALSIIQNLYTFRFIPLAGISTLIGFALGPVASVTAGGIGGLAGILSYAFMPASLFPQANPAQQYTQLTEVHMPPHPGCLAYMPLGFSFNVMDEVPWSGMTLKPMTFDFFPGVAVGVQTSAGYAQGFSAYVPLIKYQMSIPMNDWWQPTDINSTIFYSYLEDPSRCPIKEAFPPIGTSYDNASLHESRSGVSRQQILFSMPNDRTLSDTNTMTFDQELIVPERVNWTWTDRAGNPSPLVHTTVYGSAIDLLLDPPGECDKQPNKNCDGAPQPQQQ